jgi:flagella synthesis protein FlgN
MATTSFKPLQSILQTEQQLSEQLLAIMMAERDALINSDIDTINAMSEKKQPLVLQLEQLGRQRDAILQAEGFTADKEGLSAYISNQTPQDAERLASMIENLKITARKCRENNHINGGIVNVNRQHLQRAMNIFRGRDINASSYGPGGEYTSQVVRQPLLGRV